MPEHPEHNQVVDWEAMRRNLVEALAEAENWAAEYALEMRLEARQAWREVDRLSKGLSEAK